MLVKDGLVAEGIAVLEHARKADPSSYELAFALGGAYLVKGDPRGRSTPTTRPWR